MDVGLLLGNHMGDAYVMRDLMRDLNVMISVSFCWPPGASKSTHYVEAWGGSMNDG